VHLREAIRRLGAAAREQKKVRGNTEMTSHRARGKAGFFCGNEDVFLPTLSQLSFFKLPEGDRAEGLLHHAW
jgi:CHAD domain-containing protein